jgi:hypothetical protein
LRTALLSALVAAALSTAGPAPAQCTGYLIPKEATLWTESDKDEPRVGDREDYLPAVARRAWNPGLGVKLQKGLRLNWLGGCRPEDAEHDKKSKRVHVVLLDARTEDFEEVWALPSELLTFKYEYPGSDQDGPENVAAVRKAAELAVAEIRAKDFKRPEIENQRVFRASFDATWRALVENISAQKWQVDRIDKASGVVTTKPAEDRAGPAMVCATKHDGRSSVLMSIFAGKTAGGLRVTVNTTFVAAHGHDVVACYSNGMLEKELLDGIGKSLGASLPK